MIMFHEWVVLVALLTACGFVTYLVHEVGCVIQSWLEE